MVVEKKFKVVEDDAVKKASSSPVKKKKKQQKRQVHDDDQHEVDVVSKKRKAPRKNVSIHLNDEVPMEEVFVSKARSKSIPFKPNVRYVFCEENDVESNEENDAESNEENIIRQQNDDRQKKQGRVMPFQQPKATRAEDHVHDIQHQGPTIRIFGKDFYWTQEDINIFNKALEYGITDRGKDYAKKLRVFAGHMDVMFQHKLPDERISELHAYFATFDNYDYEEEEEENPQIASLHMSQENVCVVDDDDIGDCIAKNVNMYSDGASAWDNISRSSGSLEKAAVEDAEFMFDSPQKEQKKTFSETIFTVLEGFDY